MFFRSSFLFVDFFFVLSGFVITHAYWLETKTAEDAAFFMLRRLGRLWPLQVATLTAFGLLFLLALRFRGLEVVTGEATSASFATNFFLVHALGIHNSATWNYPSWSISAEFVTYGIFAFACVVFALRRSVLPAIALAALGLATLVTFGTSIDVTYDFGLFRCLYGFFVGHIVYRLTLRVNANALSLWPLAEIAIVGAVVLLLSTDDRNIRYLSPLLFGVCVFVFAQEKGVLSAVLKSRPIAALGRWSYSIYMTHALVIVLVYNVATTLQSKMGLVVFAKREVLGADIWLINIGGRFTTDAIVIAYLAILIGLSALTYRLIEIPGQKAFALLIRKIESARRAGAGRSRGGTNGTKRVVFAFRGGPSPNRQTG
jgi:peptidoglycan/LPS O-acetylase OafA/YrhL